MLRLPLSGLVKLSRTLTFKVAAASLVSAVLATLSMTWWVVSVIEEQTIESLQRNSAASVEASAQLLDSRVEIMQTVLSGAAPSTSSLLRADQVEQQAHLNSQESLFSLFDWVFIGNTRGRLAVSAGPHAPVDMQSLAAADQQVWGQELTLSLRAAPFHLSALLRGADPSILLAVPLRDPQGRTLGVIGGVVRLASPRMRGIRSAVDQGNAFTGTLSALVARDGTLLLHPDRRWVLAPVSTELALKQAFEQWVDAGSTVHAEGVASHAEKGLIALAGVPTADWLLMRWVDDKYGLQPLRDRILGLWRVGLLVTLLVSFVAALGVWFSTRSVRQLQSQAERLLEDPAGNGEREWLNERSDIGRLAQAFRQVVEQREQRGAQTQHLLDQLQAVLDLAPVGIALTSNGRIELVGQPMAALLGCSVAELLGASTRLVETEDGDREALVERVRYSLVDTGYFDGNARIRRMNGGAFHARLRARAVLKGRLDEGTVWVIEDVTAELEAQQNLSWRAGHDPLTGLSNRHIFEREMQAAFDTPVTAEQPPFCALFIDLDRFKQVNDNAGHAAGDKVLCDVSMLMIAQVRQEDVVARIGGDEFAVLLPHCPLHRAMEIAEAIRREVENYRLQWGEMALGVGASIGVIINSGGYENTDMLMRAADAACYVAKHGGRNRVVVGERTLPA